MWGIFFWWNPTFSCSWLLSCAAAAKWLQSCPTLCDPIDGSPPGSPIPGILQARILERVAISFSNYSKFPTLSDPMDCSPTGFSIHGIFQARVLELGAITKVTVCGLWSWIRLLRVPWMAKGSNQCTLKEINTEYSLEELMLTLTLQYFGHLMQRTD